MPIPNITLGLASLPKMCEAGRSIGGAVRGVLDGIHSPSDAADLNGVIKDATGSALSEFENLFETSETAAEKQALRNEQAAINAWQRSELAADRAAARTRELRSTAYQDTVASLKAAGLNPVLAASGGISGGSVTAPMAQAPAASSNMAEGMKAADLLQFLVNYVGSISKLLDAAVPL